MEGRGRWQELRRCSITPGVRAGGGRWAMIGVADGN